MGRLAGRLPSRQTFATAGTGVGVYALSAITGPLLAGALGPAGRGDLSAVQVPAQLFGYLLCFGLPEAAVYFAPRHRARASVTTAWVFAVGVGGVAAAGLWWLIPGYLSGHAAVTVPWLRATMLMMLAFAPVTVSVNLLRQRPSMTAYNVMFALPNVLNTVAIVVLRVSGTLTLEHALAAFFASQSIWDVVVIVLWRGWPSARPDRAVMAAELRYGARVAVGSLSELTVSRLDQFLLVTVISSAQLGLYAVAATAAGVSGPAAFGIALLLFPKVRDASGDREGWHLTRSAMRVTFATSMCIALIIASTAPVVFPLLFGPKFHGALVPLWLLLPGQVGFDLANVVSQRLLASNRPGAMSQAYLFAAMVTVVGLAIAIGPFGIDGAAVVTSLSQFGYLGYLLVLVRPGRAGRAGRRSVAPEPAVLTGDGVTGGGVS